MKTYHAIAVSQLVGAALGAAAVHSLHAQAKPLVYTVNEAVTDFDLAKVDT